MANVMESARRVKYVNKKTVRESRRLGFEEPSENAWRSRCSGAPTGSTRGGGGSGGGSGSGSDGGSGGGGGGRWRVRARVACAADQRRHPQPAADCGTRRTAGRDDGAILCVATPRLYPLVSDAYVRKCRVAALRSIKEPWLRTASVLHMVDMFRTVYPVLRSLMRWRSLCHGH